MQTPIKIQITNYKDPLNRFEIHALKFPNEIDATNNHEIDAKIGSEYQMLRTKETIRKDATILKELISQGSRSMQWLGSLIRSKVAQ